MPRARVEDPVIADLTDRGVACVILVALIAHGLLARLERALRGDVVDEREREENDSW